MSCAPRSNFVPSWAAPISCTARRRSATSPTPADAKRAEEAWSDRCGGGAEGGCRLLPGAAGEPDCNFINTLAEASAVVQRIGNPAFKSMVDTLGGRHRWKPSR